MDEEKKRKQKKERRILIYVMIATANLGYARGLVIEKGTKGGP